MPDWENPNDYVFADANRPARWVWEFLRRNPEYRADFEALRGRAQKRAAQLMADCGVRLSRPLSPYTKSFGRRWRLKDGIQNPDCDAVPEFLFPEPVQPLLNEVARYFYPPKQDGYAVQRPSFAVLVFSLTASLGEQLDGAELLLQKLQKQRDIHPHHSRRSLTVKTFPTYLRLLDAAFVGAKTKAIVESIAAYHKIKHQLDTASQYGAAKRLRRDRATAKRLVDDPWSLFG